MIQRKNYVKHLLQYKDLPVIKVLSGVRRSGKSTILQLFIDQLMSDGIKKSQIHQINFEDLHFENLKVYTNLFTHLEDKIIPDVMNYIFLDEIQEVYHYEKVISSLLLKSNVDIYITGSNAHFLSGELATLLSGRYIEIPVLPLSFDEFNTVHKINNLTDNYNKYVNRGSFPFLINIEKDENQIKEYLTGIYNTVLLKDVVQRKKVNDVMILESLVRFLSDNIGQINSTKKISDTLTSMGRKISTHTVERYISGLTDALLFYPVYRYDIKGKEYLKTGEKYYIVDQGLRNLVLGSKTKDFGSVLENIAFLDLYQRGYKISIGKIDNLEVDFVATSPSGEIEYYQICLTVRDETTLNRELKPLYKIRDSHPKYLITLDNDPERQFDGIKQINALEWFRREDPRFLSN